MRRMIRMLLLDDYEVKKRFRPFEELANKIEEVESSLRAALVLRDKKRARQKEKELAMLRKEVKLVLNKQKKYW